MYMFGKFPDAMSVLVMILMCRHFYYLQHAHYPQKHEKKIQTEYFHYNTLIQ